MMIQTVLFLRGLPGSGKSALAKTLEAALPDAKAIAADDWFDLYLKGRFDPTRLKEAHEWCQQKAEDWLRVAGEMVIIHNTGTQRWEIEPYAELAAKYGARFHVAHVEGNFGSVHGVTDEGMQRMAARWEPWVAKDAA